jgi:N-acylglucosamine 2-epimerase
VLDLSELADRYRRNLLESVIPFWERHSLDRVYGGQLHCLTRDGKVFDSRKYVWMQGRAVWMFSRLYNTVERRPEWIEAARSILEFLRAHARDPEGRCYFSLTRDGRPVFLQRKPYAAFFLALGLIEYAKTGAPADGMLQEAVALAGDIERWIADPTLLGRPALGGAAPVRQLADIMVQASLALELLAVDENPRYAAMLRRALQQVQAHWLPEQRTLLENLPLNGAHYSESPDTRLLCPGSAVETAWFLLHAIELLETRYGESHARTAALLYDVIEGSLEAGWDREHGGLFYFLDAAGLPCLQLEANMKLWWPHTEAIYALVLAYTRTRDEKWLDWLSRVDAYAFRTFVDWDCGEWFGYCDRYGTPTHQLKGGPYKGFFHVPRCLLFSLERLRSL